MCSYFYIRNTEQRSANTSHQLRNDAETFIFRYYESLTVVYSARWRGKYCRGRQEGLLAKPWHSFNFSSIPAGIPPPFRGFFPRVSQLRETYKNSTEKFQSHHIRHRSPLIRELTLEVRYIYSVLIESCTRILRVAKCGRRYQFDIGYITR